MQFEGLCERGRVSCLFVSSAVVGWNHVVAAVSVFGTRNEASYRIDGIILDPEEEHSLEEHPASRILV